MGTNSDPDTITLVYLMEPVCDAALINPMSQPSSQLETQPNTIDCFEMDTWAYIYNPATEAGEFFLITDVQDATGRIQHSTMSLSTAYPAGSMILMVEMVTFYVDNTTDPEHPKLMIERMDGVPHIYADNIEDLQVSYTLGHGAVVDQFVTPYNVREVNLLLTARTNRHDFITGEDFVRDTFATTVYVRNIAF
jgi:hypothetical protein